MKRENFALADGRNLEFLTNGPLQGSGVILHSGTTQDLTGWQTWLDYFKAQGVFALSFGRSGYSASTVMPGRITIDVAKDVSELCDFLSLNKFVSIGLSGGGQHAIATGLDPRSAGIVTIGGLAPFTELGESFYTGMQQADIDEYGDALNDINLLVTRFKEWEDGDIGESIAGTQLSERDKLASERLTWKVALDSCVFTMKQGWGWVADDYSSYLRPWGFDPRDVNVPVIIWQGGLDKNVPVQHGKWLASKLPNAKLELREDESHMGIFVNYEKEIMQSAIALLCAGNGGKSAKNVHRR